jgi:hypothetical protein
MRLYIQGMYGDFVRYYNEAANLNGFRWYTYLYILSLKGQCQEMDIVLEGLTVLV